MKISIVTISFNQAEFIERTIKSILNQKQDVDIEYIVVDAGSTDGSREIIESYRDQIDHIIFESDNGPADGLNKGFSFATGDIIGYINSDDILCADALSYVDNYFRQFKGDVDVLSGAAKLIGPTDEVYRTLYSDVYDPLAFAYSGCILIQPSSFFTRDIFFKTKGFNINNKTNWDGELFVDMSIAGAKFRVVSNILSSYRVHNESITGTMSTANKMQTYRREIYTKITGKNISSYSKPANIYYKYMRKIKNWRDTYQRIKGGRSFGRAL